MWLNASKSSVRSCLSKWYRSTTASKVVPGSKIMAVTAGRPIYEWFPIAAHPIEIDLAEDTSGRSLIWDCHAPLNQQVNLGLDRGSRDRGLVKLHGERSWGGDKSKTPLVRRSNGRRGRYRQHNLTTDSPLCQACLPQFTVLSYNPPSHQN